MSKYNLCFLIELSFKGLPSCMKSYQCCALRDGPLEKLWGGGGGEFSSRRNFFSLSNSLYEFILGHSMNIF